MDKMTWIEFLLAAAGVALMAVTVLLALIAILAAIFSRTWIRQAAQKVAIESANNKIDDFINNLDIDDRLARTTREKNNKLSDTEERWSSDKNRQKEND